MKNAVNLTRDIICLHYDRKLDEIIKYMDENVVWSGPVSYTHLDVYKRQGYPPFRPAGQPEMA